MWIQINSLLLLLLVCFIPTNQGQNIWNDPIKFKTKANDLCTMTVTGHGDFTRLRVSCQSSRRSYWCEFTGKPYTCRTYNKNPRHYFLQMMWGLRKLNNACQGPKHIQPHMCRKATDESQMVFLSASFSRAPSDASSRPRPQTRPQIRPYSTKQSVKSTRVAQREKTTQETTTQTQTQTAPMETDAKRMARLYCWRSLHGVCSYVIGLFRN